MSHAKRQKLDHGTADPSLVRQQRGRFLATLERGVSPPSGQQLSASIQTGTALRSANISSIHVQSSKRTISVEMRSMTNSGASESLKSSTRHSTKLSSSIQLTRISDLEESENEDAVSLSDILGDPLISEAWIFNFCFDVDWLMQHFDPDTRQLVKVKIIHGSWRREDMNKILIDDACKRISNVDSIQAYLPDAFGTHHSKMFILFRHDDTAQVVIHTANMLAKDWTNMTQAVWRSPPLPIAQGDTGVEVGPIGSGSRFKQDLLSYLKSYGSKLNPLTKRLALHDFAGIKAALIASVPSYCKAKDETVWGHEMLRRALQTLPTKQSSPHFVFQVSSLASLPQTWLQDTLYRATGGTDKTVSIVFPTAEDVRLSLDGYAAGGSIHTKAQTDVHLKQISRLRPQLCRWTQGAEAGASTEQQAGRHLAAPHIKTYIRFRSKPTAEDPAPAIDWALVTSANLSKQAWGSSPKLPRTSKDTSEAVTHIQSFEIGVLVWPELFGSEEESVTMVPTFRSDDPVGEHDSDVVVGFRMPYDLPLTPYGEGELPWSPQSVYRAPDRHGFTWPLPND